MIKIVFFDIDGTLRYNKQIPASAKRAIDLLKQHEILPVLSTGRSEHEVEDVRRELGIDWAITCNGGHIGYQGRTVAHTPLDRTMIEGWMQTAAAHGHTLLFYSAGPMQITRPDCPLFARAKQEIGFLDPQPLRSIDELPDVYQCIVFCSEEEESIYTEHCLGEISLHRWAPYGLDLNPRGTNKSVGIAQLLEHLNLQPEQAAAFGDGLNDLEMIQFVGRGIAMGNSCQELLTVAPYRTRTAEEDGILYGVQTIIL